MINHPKNCLLCNTLGIEKYPQNSNWNIDCPKCGNYIISDMMFLALTEEPEQQIGVEDFNFRDKGWILSLMVRKKFLQERCIVRLHTEDAKALIQEFNRISTSDRERILREKLFSIKMGDYIKIDDKLRMDVLCETNEELSYLIQNLEKESIVELDEHRTSVRLTLSARKNIEEEQKRGGQIGFKKH